MDRNTDGNGSLDERLCSMQDGNWNVVAIATPTGLNERYVYSAYGCTSVVDTHFEPKTDAPTQFNLFTAREWNASTGLYDFRSRSHHSNTGSFVSRDWRKYSGGDTNLYAYVSLSPLNFVDPFGTKKHHWFMKFWRSGAGQKMVDDVCPCPRIIIDHYTTDYTTAEHKWLHSSHGGEVFISYKRQYETILSRSKSCCKFLKSMFAMMVAWHAAIRLARDLGKIVDSEPPSNFDLINYNSKLKPPISTLPQFSSKIALACGKSNGKETVRDIDTEVDTILNKIKSYAGLTSNTQLHSAVDFIFDNPLVIVTPLPIKQPVVPSQPVLAR
jgi:RHS repeat-associated protein